MSVRTSVEAARGCGFRQPGGMYLVSNALSEPCPRLPVVTDTCPTCGEGIRVARGYTWVDGGKLIPPEHHGTEEHDLACPLSPAREDGAVIGSEVPGGGALQTRLGDRCGLIWIGERFYPTSQSFMAEAAQMGVSRRISAVPRDFVVGETWVLLGHRRATTKACPDCSDEPGGDPDCPACDGEGFVHLPGIITAFQPTAVEYIVKGDETEEELEALENRGLSLVKVIPAEQIPLEVE